MRGEFAPLTGCKPIS